MNTICGAAPSVQILTMTVRISGGGGGGFTAHAQQGAGEGGGSTVTHAEVGAAPPAATVVVRALEAVGKPLLFDLQNVRA